MPDIFTANNKCAFHQNNTLIKPACRVETDSPDLQEWLDEQHRQKHFIMESSYCQYSVLKECPRCGYRFTEADYNIYT